MLFKIQIGADARGPSRQASEDSSPALLSAPQHIRCVDPVVVGVAGCVAGLDMPQEPGGGRGIRVGAGGRQQVGWGGQLRQQTAGQGRCGASRHMFRLHSPGAQRAHTHRANLTWSILNLEMNPTCAKR